MPVQNRLPARAITEATDLLMSNSCDFCSRPGHRNDRAMFGMIRIRHTSIMVNILPTTDGTALAGTCRGLVVVVNQKFTVKRRLRLRHGSTGRTSLALALGRKPSAPRLPWRRAAKR